jgi:serine/threonine protein kinase
VIGNTTHSPKRAGKSLISWLGTARARARNGRARRESSGSGDPFAREARTLQGMGSADTAATPPDLAGRVVAGRYRILALVSEGAMGLVYAAWHIGLDQRVAFKVLRRARGGGFDPVARQRFQREARAAARIQSDYICRVLDTGVLDDDTPFLVMEYLEGRDLAAELAARGPLPVAEAVHYIRQACAALAEAHRGGIVHRDLKPANLFLQETQDALRLDAPGRRLKLLDFGISKSARSEEANVSLTRTSTLLGSPIYMSPEQLNSSRDVDARSDVWALGVILYELITGAPPFEADSMAQLVNAVLYRPPTPAARHGVSLPESLEDVFQRVLHKDRERRYQSAVELAAALSPFEAELADEAGVISGSVESGPRVTPSPYVASTLSLQVGKGALSSVPPARTAWRLPSTAWLALIGLSLGFAAAGTHGFITRRAPPPRLPVLVSSSAPAASPPASSTLPQPAAVPAPAPLPDGAPRELGTAAPAQAPKPWDLAVLPQGELPPAAPWPYAPTPTRVRRHTSHASSAPSPAPSAAPVEARGFAREQSIDARHEYPVSNFGGRR